MMPATASPAPMAKIISVAEGTRQTTRWGTPASRMTLPASSVTVTGLAPANGLNTSQPASTINSHRRQSPGFLILSISSLNFLCTFTVHDILIFLFTVRHVHHRAVLQPIGHTQAVTHALGRLARHPGGLDAFTFLGDDLHLPRGLLLHDGHLRCLIKKILEAIGAEQGQQQAHDEDQADVEEIGHAGHGVIVAKGRIAEGSPPATGSPRF
ncbi:hypothetical protein DESC_180028 [Desulfosarcina cetonica]|nr:hypothetical protein DESC_180028 [Desulfosarcina cetonica]